ncbi:MAG: tetratricopeptide repeat protein [Verrucomicrobiota bacterium]
MAKARFPLAFLAMATLVGALVLTGALLGPEAEPAKEDLAERPRVPAEVKPLAQAAADHFAAGAFEEAATQYERIIDRYPDSLYAWSNLGVVRSYQKCYGEAEAALRQAIELSPKDASAWMQLGVVYYQTGELEKSIEALERSLELRAENSQALAYLESAQERKSWQEEAIEDMKRQQRRGIYPLLDAPFREPLREPQKAPPASPLLDAPSDHFNF